MRGRELPDPLEEGILGMVEAGPFEVIEDGALVRRGPPYDREQALDFGREGESHAVPGIVERLHAQAVSGAKKPAAVPVPDGEREHPVETRDAGFAPFPVGREQDLGVGCRAEPVSLPAQLLAELDVVVDFPVVGDPAAAVFCRHRLVAEGREVHDRQPTVAQGDRVTARASSEGVRQPSLQRDRLLPSLRVQQHVALPVWPAMRLEAHHALQH